MSFESLLTQMNLNESTSNTSTVSDMSDDDDFSLLDLLIGMEKQSEDLVLAEHGYEIVRKLQDTLQGELYLAEVVTDMVKGACQGDLVVIKKAEKALVNKHIVKQDDGFHVLVDNDIRSEAKILREMASCAKSPVEGVLSFVEQFSSEQFLYMVTKYVTKSVSLSEFIRTSHERVAQETLSRSLYMEAVQSIMTQLCRTVHWMHKSLKCCHLDLCADNIRIQHSEWQNIKVTVCDFGVAESFASSRSFECTKNRLNLSTEAYWLPQAADCELFDARHADVWSLGMLLNECVTGEALFEPTARWAQTDAFKAVEEGNVHSAVEMNAHSHFYSKDSLSLLCNLLRIDPQQRMSTSDIVQHLWLS